MVLVSRAYAIRGADRLLHSSFGRYMFVLQWPWDFPKIRVYLILESVQ